VFTWKKKAVIAVFTASLLTAGVCMAEQTAYEPEDGGGASFSTHDFISHRIIGMDIYYTNYVNPNHSHEHWFRISCSGSRVKLLDHMSLIIDGTRYDIQALPSPSEKYILAGYSLVDNKNHLVPFGGFVASARSNTRFFILTDEQVEKLKTAQNAKIVLDTTKAVNMKFDITKDFLASINKMNGYELADLSNLWHPNDQNGYERTD